MARQTISVISKNDSNLSGLLNNSHQLEVENIQTSDARKILSVDSLENIWEQRSYDDSSELYSVMTNIEMDLQELSRDVHDHAVVKSNLEYMKILAHNDVPTLLIKEILNDNGLLVTVAARSYAHVNHFDKIVLVDNPDPQGYRLTLHSWNKRYTDSILKEELIHNHRFSFWSHVYRGRLISENFLEAKSFSVERKTFNKYKYLPSKTGNIHTCTADGEAQLIKLDNSYVDEGETYYLNYNTTHRVILPTNGKSICTFVLRGPREREYTNTYNTFYPDRGIESSVPMMTPEQLRIKLINILGDK